MSCVPVLRNLITTLPALLLAMPFATPVFASAPLLVVSVAGGGPALDEVFALWDHDVATVGDPSDFTVWDAEDALVATGTAAVIDDTDGAQVNVELDVPLTDGTEYTLKVAAGVVSDGTDTNGAIAGETFTADGSAPTPETAVIDGAELAVAFDEELDERFTPDATDFEVTADGTSLGVAGVEVASTAVTLTLDNAPVPGDVVLLDYSAASANLRDPAGNIVEAFQDLAAAFVDDTTPPELTSATLTDDFVLLEYDEVLDDASIPSPLDYEVEVDGADVGIVEASVGGPEVVLTLERVVAAGDGPVVLDYSGTAVRDLAGNPASALSGEVVTNETRPVAILGDDDPLRLEVNDQLRCALFYENRSAYFAATACGTFVSVDGELFGPVVPAGPSVVPFTPVSQSPVSGAGTLADPFVVTTVVELGGTGITVTQVDRVDTSDETSSEITLSKDGGPDAAVVVYRAADCALDGDDAGFGAVDAETGSVSCVQADRSGAEPVAGSGRVTFTPGAPGARYEAAFHDVWADLENGSSFDNTCACDEDLDHGMGLSWAGTLEAGATATYTVDTTALIEASEPEEEGGTPLFASADVDGDVLAVWYDRQLDPAYSPDPQAWSVVGSVSGEIALESGPSWGGDEDDKDHFLLFLAEAVQADEDVLLSYDSTFDAANALRSPTGELAASLVDEEVANNTPLPEIECTPPAVNAQLTNMGFEQATEAEPHYFGWTAGDLVDTIARTGPDGYAVPWEGGHMARLGSTYASSDLTQPEGMNELCQDFVVTRDRERFAYNIFTYDYQGFDRFGFHLTVTDPDDGEVLAAYEQDSWGEDGDTSLKTSGWQGVTLDLSGHIGETVRLAISSGSTQDDLYGFWVYLDSAEDGLPTPSQPLTDVQTETGSSTTDPTTGQVTVSMPFGAPSPVTLTTAVSCEGVLGEVSLLFGGASYPMMPNGQSGEYTVTIPQADIASAAGGAVVTSVECDGTSTLNQVARIVLYDPSGIVTDAVTGEPVVGAFVTLFKVPGWTPRTSPQDTGDGTCESNASREGADWSQAAPTHLGLQVSPASPEISPNVNPFVTNAIGYYGWDVAEGCWFVTVAKSGYVTLTSPVVGVPTEVTDLDLQLTPVPVDEDEDEDEDEDDSGGGGRGGSGRANRGSSTPSPAVGTAIAAVRPDNRGNAATTLRLPSGPITVVLTRLSASAQLRVQELAASPLNSAVYLPVGKGYTVTLQGARAGAVQVCLPSSAVRLSELGATPQEVRLLRNGADTTDITTTADRRTVCGGSTSLGTFAAGVPKAGRVGGGDRIATAAAVSKSRFPSGTAVAYLATGADFADALSGGPAAAREGAPLLLTSDGELPAPTLTELDRLGAARIVVLGGPGAVPDAVLAQLSALGATAVRMSGGDRYATAATVSAATFAPGVEEVFVATGENFPDALVGGAVAARRGAPVLLVPRDGLPAVVADELARLEPAKVTVLGGTAAVSPAVAAELGTFTTGEVARISGSDRYATAAAISARYFDGGRTIFVATGSGFADALSAVPAAALTGAPVLLVEPGHVPGRIREEIRRMDPVRSLVIGGRGAVSAAVRAEVERLVG